MLLSSVIIILREVLEASLLIGVLLALSKQLELSYRWVFWSIVMGASGAFLYAATITFVSEWFEGVGQEVVNALLQMSVFLLLLIFIVLIVRQFKRSELNARFVAMIMAVIVSLAITREGSEILIYLNNFTQVSDHFPAVLSGAIIGASIGCSAGIIVYHLLCNVLPRWSVNMSVILLIMIAAGMISQASLLLIQADWLPSQLPLWNSSGFISEQSVLGQLLYAVIGYEATPTPIQAGFYFGGLTIPTVLFLIANRVTSSSS